MKRFIGFGVVLCSFIVATAAFADSSGNFTAAGTSATCTATPATFSPSSCTNSAQCVAGLSCVAGLCTGGPCTANADCPTGAFCNASTSVCQGLGGFTGATLSGGTALTTFKTAIQTPNGLGTTLLIRPSLATGLFTSTKLSTTISNATADVGIQVCVYVDPVVSGGTISGGLPVSPTQCVVYDQRIQQVSNSLFGNLLSCVPPPASGACTTDADCPAGNTCINATGGTGAGLCQAPAAGCSFEILLTTLSAHSFDFVVPVGNGSHNVVLTWGLIGTGNNTSGGSTAACVGPVTFTVVQVKNFHNDSTISFSGN